MLKKDKITDDWFYSDPWFWGRLVGIYVKGDAIILLPFVGILLLTGIYSLRFMLFGFAVYFTLRALSEMIYWFFQQFGQKTYRPKDYGLKKLSNNSIYILYQLISLITAVIWIMFILFIVGVR